MLYNVYMANNTHHNAGFDAAEESREILFEPNVIVRVHKERKSPESWDYLGRMKTIGPVMVGERMVLGGLDGAKSLDTSAIVSADRKDDEIVVRTAYSTYSVKLAQDRKQDKDAQWTLPSLQDAMVSLGGQVQRLLRGY